LNVETEVSIEPDNGTTVLQEEGEGQRIELSIVELVQFAMQMHQENRLDAAEKCYRTALKVDSNNANALHFLGVLLHQRARNSEAIESIQRSMELDPQVAAWHNNLGNVMLDANRFDEAAAAYQRCTELAPDNVEVLNNLGVLLRKLKRPLEAEESLKRAIALNPTYSGSHANLATLCAGQGRMTEAFSHFADALALRPGDSEIRRLLVLAYGKAGRFDEAQQACRDWLDLEPDNPKAQHFLAAYGGGNVPDRASDQYVTAEFDGFAGSFDAKLASLEYRAPQWVGEEVAKRFGAPNQTLEIMDAGCGTGLCASYLRPYAKCLSGVDLSSNMLNRAKDRNAYDSLIHAELVACLSGYDHRFDLIVSADTLCYFGNLVGAFSAVKQALCPGGRWIFTLESHSANDDFQLQHHGRYSHSQMYVERELKATGFESVDLQSVNLRFEGGEPVRGWLVSAC